MSEKQKLTAVFTVEKETKNTIRYQEVVSTEPPVVGTIYIQKYAANKLGNPSKITVTVEAA
jgi:hypothetical protein